MDKLTLEDIKRAIDLIKEHHKEEEIYEDEYQKIYGEYGVPTKIQLKKKGVKLLSNLIEGAGEIKLVDLSKGIELVKGMAVKHGDHFHEGGIDPHVWSSPLSVKIIAKNTLETLVAYAPEKKGEYEKNYNAFLLELAELDQMALEAFQTKQGKSFIGRIVLFACV